MIKSIFASILLVFVMAFSYAQELTISGKIVDKKTNNPIGNVTIQVLKNNTFSKYG